MQNERRVGISAKIPGWTTVDELRWLAQTADGLPLVVEFGAWCGRSSVALSSAGLVISVDTWGGSPEHRRTIEAGLNPWKEWCENTGEFRNIVPYRCDLARPDDLVEFVSSRGGADLVFVDAAHDHESVARDIRTAKAMVRSGGVVCGHDYMTADWPEVTLAVNEEFDNVETCVSIWRGA